MENTRNFCILAHIDHGKSTLADRFLELTGTIAKGKMRPQYLDMMELEKEKGITIKLQPVRMNYTLNGESYILNLIDTPGHVDFSYEVSRSLAAVEGAILLVDAIKGIQAQTLANLELAKRQKLTIIPVINKIDLAQAKIEETEKEISDLLKIDPGEIIKISAKQGTNVEQVLASVIEKIPPPKNNYEKPLRALIFDSKYDSYKGVIAFVRIFDGEIKKGEKIYLIQAKTQAEAKEIGIFKPELRPVEELKSNDIGYIATGIKEPGKVRIGETITKISNSQSPISKVEALPGHKKPKPMVFFGLYPEKAEDFESLKDALEKLSLNDAALTFKPESKEYLGRGFQCGFLGLLHVEIVFERIKREFALGIILSAPAVSYKLITQQNQELFVCSSADWPEASNIKEVQELWVNIQILTPSNYLGQVLELLKSIEPKHLKTNYLSPEKWQLVCQAPWREIIDKNFYDKLKSISQGFASMNYEMGEWRVGNLVKLDILILGKKQTPFSKIVPQKQAQKEGKKIVEKLKQILPPQLFAVPLQAAVGGKIIARETMRALRRDVISPLYGGDYTRKRKLLEKQKKGKKKLKEKGEIHIPQKVFLEIFKT